MKKRMLTYIFLIIAFNLFAQENGSKDNNEIESIKARIEELLIENSILKSEIENALEIIRNENESRIEFYENQTTGIRDFMGIAVSVCIGITAILAGGGFINNYFNLKNGERKIEKELENIKNEQKELNKKIEELNTISKAIELIKNNVDENRMKAEEYAKFSEVSSIFNEVENQINKNDFKRAELLCKDILVLKPDFSEVYNYLGHIYREIGRKDEAIEAFQNAIDKKPNYADAYNNLGNIYNNSNREKEAIPLYEKAIELNPNHSRLYSNLGSAYTSIGLYDNAFKYHKKAVELNNEEPIIYYNLACYYSLLENMDDALQALENSLKLCIPVKRAIIEKDSELFGISALPKFKELLDKYKPIKISSLTS